MDEQEIKELTEKARYILSSKTKYAGELWQLLKFYNDSLDKAPPVQFEKPADSPRDALKELSVEMEELKKAARKLKERIDQKWHPRPALRVIQGGGNTTPITRVVTRHKNT